MIESEKMNRRTALAGLGATTGAVLASIGQGSARAETATDSPTTKGSRIARKV